MPSEHARVFISHASEDKARFVLAFAKRLLGDGVDAWVDKWEMLPGDSLVKRIFEEGLKDADTVIAVVSHKSVEKPWVREEFNTSVVARINKGIRLIPVVIDDCELPNSLSSILYERIQDLNAYDENYARILASILGYSMKPTLGKPPSYTRAELAAIGGLESIDNLVLKISCEQLLEDPHTIFEPHLLFGKSTALNLPRQEVLDSLEVLEGAGYVRLSHYAGGDAERWGCHHSVTTLGFHEYCQAYVSEFDTLLQRAGAMIANGEATTNYDLRDKLSMPIGIANHVIAHLEDRELLRTSDEVGERIFIFQVSAGLRRAFR
jgi:TIR domain